MRKFIFKTFIFILLFPIFTLYGMLYRVRVTGFGHLSFVIFEVHLKAFLLVFIFGHLIKGEPVPFRKKEKLIISIPPPAGLPFEREEHK